MPYTNIVWIKLKLELLNDRRFIFDLDETQRFIFLGLLLLAGATNNKVPDNENFIKNRLNLSLEPAKVRENLDKIFSIFPKTTSLNGFIKFSNFNDLHNQIRDSRRIAIGSPKAEPDKIRIEKKRIDIVLLAYVSLKNHSLNNYTHNDYARNGKIIKELLIRAKDDALVLEALKWMGEQKFEWTLETVNKKWVDFMAYRESKPKARGI